MKLPVRMRMQVLEAYCACFLHQHLGLCLLQQQQQARAHAMADTIAEMVVGDEHRKDRMGSALNAMVASSPPTERMAFPVPTERPDMSRILETRATKASRAPWYCDTFQGDRDET